MSRRYSYPYVVGIDASLSATGICDQEGGLYTVGKGYAGDARLEAIYGAVHAVALPGTLAIIEDLPKHAHSAGLTGMAQGAARLALRHRSIPYVIVIASQLKKYLLGKGGGTDTGKPAMRVAHFRRSGTDLADDNQVDAFWLRQMGLYACGLEHIPMPKTHRDTVLKCKWPKPVADALKEPFITDGQPLTQEETLL